jgi:hypothetical protein
MEAPAGSCSRTMVLQPEKVNNVLKTLHDIRLENIPHSIFDSVPAPERKRAIPFWRYLP